MRIYRLPADYCQLWNKIRTAEMLRTGLLVSLIFWFSFLSARQGPIERFLSDSSMVHASVSLCIINAGNGEVIAEHNSDKSLTQASVMKLITTAASIELLGPDYSFKTILGYSGTIRKGSHTLDGNIIIKGGGDPALGSENFPEHDNHFIEKWVDDITKLEIKKIKGRVLTDDSYFDYLPVPGKWAWEDIGNYYGAGAYGLSIFDNTIKIHFKTYGEGSIPLTTATEPSVSGIEYSNYLKIHSSADEGEGFVFSVPYGTSGWFAGSIPANREDFVLKASLPDPPLFLADLLERMLEEKGIKIINEATTVRLHPELQADKISVIDTVFSPHLSSIIEVLNHESVNLYAEHLVKELGRTYRGEGSTSAGVRVILDFLDSCKISTEGLFIEDGSGLSAPDAINSGEVVKLLLHMKKDGRFFDDYLKSLPDAGKEGTLTSYFKDKVFDSRLKAKSGSMTRVRSYAGFFTTMTGKEMIFSIIVNNYTGPVRKVISGIEEIIKEYILYW